MYHKRGDSRSIFYQETCIMRNIIRYAIFILLSALIFSYCFLSNFGVFRSSLISGDQINKSDDQHVTSPQIVDHTSLSQTRHPFNCQAIINGKLSEIRKADRWSPDRIQTTNFTCFSSPLPHNGTTESDFPIAFSIIAYKNPGQLHRLLRILYRPWNSYCIHLDLKADQAMIDLISTITNCHHNIWMSPLRYDVQWGQPSLLHAAISCMKMLYEKSTSWTYILNIAASDFPLMTNLGMIQALRSLNGSSDVQMYDPGEESWKYRHSFAHKSALEDLKLAMASNRSFPTKPPPPFGVQVKKGSFSATLHRDFVKFVITDQIAIKFLQYLNDTFIPDEAYWSTLYHTYLMRNNRSGSARFRTRYTHWGSYKPSCGGYYEHGLCVFGARDLRWLLKKAEGYFFAHKFDEAVHPVVLECLEEYIGNKM